MPIVAFGFSTPDIILILVVALVLFGPKNLPKMARGIGKSMEEFRRAAREIENEIMKEPEPTTPPPPPPPTPEGETHPEETSEEDETSAAPEDSDAAAESPAAPPPAPIVVSDAPVALTEALATGAALANTPPAEKVSDVTVTKPAS